MKEFGNTDSKVLVENELQIDNIDEPNFEKPSFTTNETEEESNIADKVRRYVSKQILEEKSQAKAGYRLEKMAYSPTHEKYFWEKVFDKEQDYIEYIQHEKTLGFKVADQLGIADWVNEKGFYCIQVAADCLGVYKDDELIAMVQSSVDSQDDRVLRWIYCDSKYQSDEVRLDNISAVPSTISLTDRYDLESALSLELDSLPLDYLIAIETFLYKTNDEQTALVIDAFRYFPLSNKKILASALKLVDLGDEYVPVITELIYSFSRGDQGVDEYAVSYLVESLDYVAENIHVLTKLIDAAPSTIPSKAIESINDLLRERVAESLLAVDKVLAMKEVAFILEDGKEVGTTNLVEISESMYELCKAVYAINERFAQGPEERLISENGLITYTYANRSLLLQLRAETTPEDNFDKSLEYNRELRENWLVDTQDLYNPQPIPLDINDPARRLAVSMRLDFSSAQRGEDGYTLKGSDGRTIRDYYAEYSQAEFDMGALTMDEDDPNWKIAKMLSLGNGLASAIKGVSDKKHHIPTKSNWLNSRRNFQELIQAIDEAEYSRLISK